MTASSVLSSPAKSREYRQDSQAVMAQHGRTFRMASRFLGAADAEAIFDLYAFCRELDDLVDEERGPARKLALNTVEFELRAGLSDRPSIVAFLHRMEAVEMPLELPLLLIDGLRSDLDPVAFSSEEDLLGYAYRVAGTVGLMFCHLIGVTRQEALPYAIDLGIGMQLTNIARDVLEDARRGRVYLPESLLGGPLSAQAIAAPTRPVSARVSQAIRDLVALAGRYYRSADAGFRYLPLRARLAALSASRAYERIGLELVQQGAAYEQGRHVVPPPRRAAVMASALLGTGFGSLMSRRAHDAQLHRSLHGLPSVDVSGGRAARVDAVQGL